MVYALITGLLISSYTLIDGLGVRRSGDPLGYIAWMFLIEGLPLVVFATVVRRRDIGTFLRRDWRPGVLGGVIATLGYSIVIWAMSQESMSRVVSLRETSVILAALIGVHAFGEPSGGRRIAAAVLVALGNLALQLF